MMLCNFINIYKTEGRNGTKHVAGPKVQKGHTLFYPYPSSSPHQTFHLIHRQKLRSSLHQCCTCSCSRLLEVRPLKSSPRMLRLSNLYLFIYNSVQTLGWAIAFFRIVKGFFISNSFNVAFASSGELICLLQIGAFLEVIHGALGIVPSGVLLPLMQWGGRSHYLLAIVGKIVEIQDSPSIFITFVAWCIGEMIRYSNYALSCIGKCPYWSTYIRYTAFIPVYPVGVAGEMWLMYQALPYIKEKDLYSDFFSVFPFSYHTFVQVVLLSYPYLWMKLYLYLLKQRRSKLRKNQGKKVE